MIPPALDYALRVTRELGLSGESSCVDRDKPLRVYIAVEGRLAGHPDHEVALLWTECHGWAIAVEKPGTAELEVVEHLGGAVEPPPRTVARWVRRVLARHSPDLARNSTNNVPAPHSGQVA
ncbi:hypothetical protein BBK82_40725 [Lentzea guizhouensis]|uniref:DUF6292 domain-containing protein n=1 Tax=Lentzea guizhouensis TaxID=1586287 RepID=A0A1B2HUJ5_9PSEU|nr:DUF6292 family protein [Lentzea guizhouensis]ANZ41352.1 hypothetical protein BBK82_40725 [Lentzea guizhouensis]